MPATASPRPARRTSWWDPLALIVLGLAGGALSYDALRQMAVAVHVRPHLAYLFPLVVDGFIAYGVRALLVLRNAPWPARAYAWTLFGTATAASLWANAVHAVRLNQPGVRTLTLGDHTVAALSAIAPLALAGATHMHILIGRHNGNRVRGAGTPVMIPAVPAVVPAARFQSGAHAADGQAVSGTPPVSAHAVGRDGGEVPANGERPGRKADGPSGRRPQAGRGGRKPEASIQRLTDIIRRSCPDPGQVTRAMAREAIEAQGIAAGNERIAEALRTLQAGDGPRTHPAPE
jgi:hypothetical protein